MSKIFYDHYISLSRVEAHIKNSTVNSEERDELYKIVDEIVHHKLLSVILDNLEMGFHEDFLMKFKENPHSEHIIHFLNEKTGKPFHELIEREANKLEDEIIRFLLKE